MTAAAGRAIIASRVGHDRHFLSRLDRVDDAKVALALELYRDHELVKGLLARAALPHGAERVAVALSEGPEPAHIVLQRDGHFVTCLAEGMGTGELTVIPHKELASLRRGFAARRDRNAALREIEQRGGLNGALRRIMTAGPNLSREEMEPVFRLSPIIRGLSIELWERSLKVLVEAQTRMLSQKKIGSRNDDVLELYWQAGWAHVHAGLIVFHDRAEFLEHVPAEHRAHSLSLSGMSTGYSSAYLRALAATAKAGKHALPRYRTIWKAPEPKPFVVLDCALALGAIGLRHRGLRAEITKLLRSEEGSPRGVSDLERKLLRWGVDVLVGLLADPDKDAEQRDHERRLHVVEASRKLPADSPIRFERAEDVPADVALAYALYRHDRVNAGHDHAFTRLFHQLPAIVRAAPEELYLPAKYLPLAGPSFRLAEVRASVGRFRENAPPPPPPSVPRAPGRNEACSCGSGKKYKRCCAA